MTNKVKLLTAFFVLSFAMMMGVTPFSIGGAGVLKAEAADTMGAFTVEGTDNSYSYNDSDNVLTISGDGTYEISMAYGVTTTNTDTIQVTSGDDAVIVLNGVNISSSSKSPIEIASTAGEVTIKLEGENTLTATGSVDTGLAILTTEEVTITSDDDGDSYAGSLKVTDYSTSSYYVVAIGSLSNDVTITINGGEITAEASSFYYGVGIGNINYDANITINGGKIIAKADHDNEPSSEDYIGIGIASGEGGTITINGGEITAEADGDYMGVGIGNYASGVNITINGGTVTAKANGDIWGLCIGSLWSTVNVTINGGEITAEADGDNNGIGIGTYDGNLYFTINDGKITVEANGNSYEGIGIGNYFGYADIAIKGGTVTADADSGTYGVAIGNYSGTAEIDISAGEVTAYADGDTYGVAIGNYSGTAEIDISGGEVTAEANGTEDKDSEYGVAIGSYSSAATITISDGTVTATADGDVHGLAIGSHSSTATINIEGGEVTATAGNTGYGNNYGVAIGSDDGAAYITIKGGTVTASAMGDTHGLAIGSHNSTANITIEGGTVNAEADGNDYGTAIGTDDGTAAITIKGGTITAEATGDETAGYSVKADNMYIVPPDGRALDVKYNASSEETSLYVLKTDITYKAADETSFYCSVSDGGQVVYEDRNLSVENGTGTGEVDVYVSVYGGQGARFLDEVMLVTEEDYCIVDIDQLLYYDEAKLNDDTEAVVFHAEIIDNDEHDKTFYALVRTFDNLDAKNLNENIIYYLSAPTTSKSA